MPYKTKLTPEQRAKERKRSLSFYSRNKDKPGFKALRAEYRKRSSLTARSKQKAWFAENKTKVKEWHIKSRYGLTPEQTSLMWINQLCACAICETPLADPYAGHIDHDHKTGAVRGILCKHCNAGLGMFRDSAENCTRAAAYLQRSGTT